MKKVFVFLFSLFAVLILTNGAFAQEVTTKLAWDADTQPSNMLPWDKVFIYGRQGSGAYDYTKPLATVAQTYVNGKSQPIIVTVKSIVPEQEKTTLYFVARSGNGDKRSVDSVEVSRVADTTTLNPVTTFTATHNRQTDMIDLAWSNENPRVKEWAVFVKDTIDGTWVEFDRIKRTDQGATITSSKSIVAPEGEETVKYFTVVSYAEDMFSVNSMEARVFVDRRAPLPPMGFKIEYSIPLTN